MNWKSSWQKESQSKKCLPSWICIITVDAKAYILGIQMIRLSQKWRDSNTSTKRGLSSNKFGTILENSNSTPYSSFFRTGSNRLYLKLRVWDLITWSRPKLIHQSKVSTSLLLIENQKAQLRTTNKTKVSCSLWILNLPLTKQWATLFLKGTL